MLNSRCCASALMKIELLHSALIRYVQLDMIPAVLKWDRRWRRRRRRRRNKRSKSRRKLKFEENKDSCIINLRLGGWVSIDWSRHEVYTKWTWSKRMSPAAVDGWKKVWTDSPLRRRRRAWREWQRADQQWPNWWWSNWWLFVESAPYRHWGSPGRYQRRWATEIGRGGGPNNLYSPCPRQRQRHCHRACRCKSKDHWRCCSSIRSCSTATCCCQLPGCHLSSWSNRGPTTRWTSWIKKCLNVSLWATLLTTYYRWPLPYQVAVMSLTGRKVCFSATVCWSAEPPVTVPGGRYHWSPLARCSPADGRFWPAAASLLSMSTSTPLVCPSFLSFSFTAIYLRISQLKQLSLSTNQTALIYSSTRTLEST